jgi:phosphoglycolate phosphatase-like HAD superfamily hydrolase
MTIRGIIFDLDGTLADTLPVCVRAFRTTFQRHLGQELADGEIRAMFGPSEEGVLERALAERWERGLETYLAEYEREHVRCPRPFDGIPALLAGLRERGVRRAIVTGKGPGSAEISARILGLAPYFEDVETGSRDGVVKARRIRSVLERWRLPPAQVAAIGDSPSDVRAAREEGVVPLGAAWAASAEAGRLAALEPVALFESVAAFSAWVDAHVT